MPRRVAVILLLSLLPLPPVAASHTLAAGVDGPDPDGAFFLYYDVHRDAAGPAALALNVTRTNADSTSYATRALATTELPAGATRQNVTFLPAEGAGHYVVAIVVDGARGAEVSFDVVDAASGTSVAFSVPDEPTHLDLTNDTVNADGKTKSPGEPLLTRGVLTDANGLADIDALAWDVKDASGATLIDGILPHPTNATSWSFEHRLDASPFLAGNHTLRLLAVKGSGIAASATRTFVIRDVAPTLVSGALSNVTPDEDTMQLASFVIGDRNGAPPAALEARVYRGSSRMESAGFAATLGAPERLTDADGAARFSYPLALRVPAGASAGAHRVSLYANGSLVGATPFEVLPLPTLARVNATPTTDALVLVANGTGSGLLVARLTDGNGSATFASAPFTNGSGTLTLPPPRRGVALAWNVTLFARADGPPLDAREGNWTAPANGPPLSLTPLHVRARLPAAWRVESAWPLADANASFEFTRWDGLPERRLSGSLQGDRLRVGAPPTIPAGRYSARAVVAWPNGTSSELAWSFDAGPWVEVELGAVSVDGRNASIPLRNAGGLALSRLVVETEPRAHASLLVDGQTYAPIERGARAVFAATLAPGDQATLRIELGEGPRRSGPTNVVVRVLARVDLG